MILARQDEPNKVDVNASVMLERIDNWIDGGIRLVPNLVVALLLLAVFYGLAIVLRRVVMRAAVSRGRDNLGEMLGGFAKAATLVLGGMLAATVVVPSLKPGDLIAGLGVSSVAIGFAFKDILQNWLAGLLILIRQPFEVGDQVKVGDFEGTVQRIETRATLIKTYDGQRAVIPNSQIYSDALLVKTAHAKRRTHYDVGIGYGDGVEQAGELILEAVRGVEGVEAEPAPQALPWDLAASWVTIRARWWTDSKRTDLVSVRSKVLVAIKNALDGARIDMPYETQVHLFHDQTETTDGDRAVQREGWPEAPDGEVGPRWKAQAEAGAAPRGE